MATDAERKCTTCKKMLPLGSFGRDSHRPGGVRASCKECGRGYARRWHAANPTASRGPYYTSTERKRKVRSNSLTKKHGISLVQFEAMLIEQGGESK